MNKAVFLDRDGTINVEKHYLYKIEDFEFLPRAVEGLKLLQDAGFKLIVVTNQSGIGRGYYTEEDFIRLNRWMVDTLGGLGVKIDRVYYCPHLPDAKIEKYRKICTCRKPAIGLYEQAIAEFDIDIQNSWCIGDKLRDCSISEEKGCKGVLIGNNEDAESVRQIKNGDNRRIQYAADLYEAANRIVEETR